jgi:SAM-dependent methyltransferase
MPSEEWFKNWFDSPYYHLLYANRSDKEAREFVQHLITAFQWPNETRLLDLACGKGRHAVAFAEAGLDVTGLDLAQNSIESAKSYEHERLHFYVHDMRCAFRSNYYNVVCNLFTSFGYFLSHHEHLQVARNMAMALKPGGTLILDFVNRAAARRNIDGLRHEKLEKEGVQFEIHRSYSDERFEKEIIVTDSGKAYHFKESLASFTLEEMTSLFLPQGLTLVKVYGDYQLADYDEESSTRMILQLKK